MNSMLVLRHMHVVIQTRDPVKYKELLYQALCNGLTVKLEPLEPTWYDICLLNYYTPAPALVLGEEVVRDFLARYSIKGGVLRIAEPVAA